jgi:hypothetical protein
MSNYTKDAEAIARLAEGVTLCAKQINHGQSQIWLGENEQELTPRRTLATNEVVNVTRRLCAPEVFQAFYADYHKALDRVVTLDVPNVEEIAAELMLNARSHPAQSVS